jgi:hypothetical protein
VIDDQMDANPDGCSSSGCESPDITSLEAMGIAAPVMDWIIQATALLTTWALGRPSGPTFVVDPYEDALLTQVGA